MPKFYNGDDILIVEVYLTTFSVVFLLYDHVLTLGDEILYIWSTPLKKSGAVFSLNRYIGLIGNILALLLIHWTTMDSRLCYKMNLVHQITLILVQVIVCFIISLRIYALYGCSKRVMWGLLGYASSLIGVVGWSMSGQSLIKGNSISNDCHLSIDRASAIRLAICWEALFAYDTTIFLLTLYKTWRNAPSTAIGRSRQSLSALLLRDGAFYFMFMALANLANILTFYLAPLFLRGRLSTFASCLAVTLVSRMMLNLHRANTDLGIMSTDSGMIMFQDSWEERTIDLSYLEEDPQRTTLALTDEPA
ncbi:hypothetical protein DL96DRAFT_1595773 [Flagelloscypha sp. PMI_526]|nr:hypothetical protein DL96DRAFT_1595773 [Flagelloscypha sp. PMI_526]